VRGSRGDQVVSAAKIQVLLSLRSTWIAKTTGP
jgi:hypothetical protein